MELETYIINIYFLECYFVLEYYDIIKKTVPLNLFKNFNDKLNSITMKLEAQCF